MANLKQGRFLILGFVAVGNSEERRKKKPFHMINQRGVEIHSCVCVLYFKEITLKKGKTKKKKNRNGVTRN